MVHNGNLQSTGANILIATDRGPTRLQCQNGPAVNHAVASVLV